MSVNPGSLIDNKNSANLKNFVAVKITLISELYYGAFIRYKDKNNQLYFGGYLTEIGRKNNELYIELVDNLTTPNIKYVLAIVNVSQLWKKIDFCLFEMLHLESHVIKPILRKLKRIDNTLYSLRR